MKVAKSSSGSGALRAGGVGVAVGSNSGSLGLPPLG